MSDWKYKRGIWQFGSIGPRVGQWISDWKYKGRSGMCHFWQVGLGADLWTKHMNGVRLQCVFLHELVCVCASVGWRHVFGQYLLKLRCARSCLVSYCLVNRSGHEQHVIGPYN